MSFKHNEKCTARAVGECVLGKSKEKGTPFIEFYFEVKGGENDGSRVRWTGYFTDKTAERTIDSLRTCGWKGSCFAVFADGKLHGLDSNDVQIVVEMQEYTDEGVTKLSPRVAWVNSLGFLNTQAKMKADDLASFAAKYNNMAENKSTDNSDSEDPIPF